MSEPIQPRIKPAKTKKEKKERIAVVKKILVELYKRRRGAYRSLLPTTARGDIQQANLKAFLEDDQNAGLVDRIYGLTIGQGRFRSVDEVVADLDPITIPTIFEPRVSEAERERRQGIRETARLQEKELEKIDRERTERIRAEMREERAAEIRENIQEMEERDIELEEMERQMMEQFRIAREGKSKKAQARRKKQREAAKRAREEAIRKQQEQVEIERIKIEEELRKKKEEEKKQSIKKQLKEIEKRQKELDAEIARRDPRRQAELGKKIEETAVSSSSVPSVVSSIASRLVPRRPQPAESPAELPVIETAPAPEVASLFTPEERQAIRETGLAINPSTENTANVPADPVANQRQEAQTLTLPITRPEPPSIPRIPPIRIPQLDDQSIRLVLNRVENAQARNIAEGILKGQVDPSSIQNDVIRAILRAIGFSGLTETAVMGIIRYIKSKLGQRRYKQLLIEGGYKATLPELSAEERQQAERIRAEEEEAEAMRIIDLDALEQFRNIGTPQEILERIIHLAEGENENMDAVASRVFADVSDRVIRQSILNNIDHTMAFQYLDDIRATILGLVPSIMPITQDSVEAAMTQHQEKIASVAREEVSAQAREREISALEGGASGAIGGAVSSGLSGGMTGLAGRVISGGGYGGAAGAVGGMIGGQVGKRVGGAEGKRAGQIAGGVIGGIAAGRYIGKQSVQVQEMPVEIPDQVVQQEEPLKSGSGKGTLRPKFIIPSASILDKTENEIQADLDEFSAFDYVIPTSEGTEGNISNNPLKRQAYIQNELILNGGGIDIPSQWGEEPMISVEEQKEQMIGDKLSPIPELKMGVVDEDISVGFYTEKVQPNLWNAGSIKLDPYYRNYTRVTDLNDNIVRSDLYGWQY